MTAPLVSVVMSVHNGAATITAAVRSILWQTFTDWELIVVDDASTDETAAVVARFRDPRIRLIHGLKQLGLAARLNQCVELARGTYIARMDADDIAYPHRFQRQVAYLQLHSDVDLVGHGAVLFKGEGEVIGLYPMAERHEDICRRPWWGFPLAHPTWMGKRSWFLKNRYDKRLMKGQDQELLLRAWRQSRFASLPECLLGYRIEKISIVKSVRGRMAYCRRLLRQTNDVPSALDTLRGLGVHGLAFVRDAVLDVTGSTGVGIRQSYLPADENVRREWQIVWNRLAF